MIRRCYASALAPLVRLPAAPASLLGFEHGLELLELAPDPGQELHDPLLVAAPGAGGQVGHAAAGRVRAE